MRISVGYYQTKPHYTEAMRICIESSLLSYNRYSEEFEARFAELCNSRFAILCGSGTDALRIALNAVCIVNKNCEWVPDGGGEVLVPASTFVATVNVVLQLGMTPVLVDIDDTWNMDPQKALEAVEYNTVAAIPVHLFGQPADMPRIAQLIGGDGKIALIEDACEAMGARVGGWPVGCWGDLGCFSLYVAHHITAGVGGVITTSDPELAAICRSLANHGRSPSYYKRSQLQATANDPEQRFVFEHIGYSSRISEPMVALATAQLDELGPMLDRRLLVALRLRDGLLGLEMREKLRLQKRGESFSANMMLPLMILEGSRKDFMVYLEEKGIETRTAMPILTQPCYMDVIPRYARAREIWPRAWELATKGLYIGCHQGLTDEDISYVLEVIHGYFA